MKSGDEKQWPKYCDNTYKDEDINQYQISSVAEYSDSLKYLNTIFQLFGGLGQN